MRFQYAFVNYWYVIGLSPYLLIYCYYYFILFFLPLPLQPLLDFKCVRVGGEPSVDGSVPVALNAPLIKVPLANAPADAVRGVARCVVGW
jgi:hypothetical protein